MSSPLRVAAVVFDLDDTLMPEHDYVRSGYRHVARWLSGELGVGADQLEADLWEIFDSKHRSRAYNRLLELHGADEALVPECVRQYREHLPEVELTPATRGVVEWCLERGPVGVVTDGPGVMQAAKARALGLAGLGVEVVLSDDLGGREAWKPSPAGMLEVCRRMGVDPARAVYVGDNPAKDFLAAHAAGMTAVRYRTPGQLHHAVEPAAGTGPDREVDDLAALREVLDLG